MFSVRSETIGEIPIIRASKAKTPKERMGLVVERLKIGNSKPRSLAALKSSIEASRYEQISEPIMQSVVDQMIKAAFVTVTDDKVSFNLTQAS